jgi:hypothetical protein
MFYLFILSVFFLTKALCTEGVVAETLEGAHSIGN